MNREVLIEQTGLNGDLERQARYREEIYEFKLYVAGNNAKSRLASDNLKNICNKYLAGKGHIEIIDLTKNPKLAKSDQIIAVPTLMIKNFPGRRIIGDLSDPNKVLECLR